MRSKGMLRKIIILCLVGVAHIVNANSIGTSTGIRIAVIFFYPNNEGVPILENATLLSLTIPVKLKNILVQLREGEDEEMNI